MGEGIESTEIVIGLSSLLSSISCVIILLFFCAFKRLFGTLNKMIFVLIVSDLEWSVINFCQIWFNNIQWTKYTSLICTIFGFFQVQSIILSTYLTCTISFCVTHNQFNHQKKLKYATIFYSFFVAIIQSPLIWQHYGVLKQQYGFNCLITSNMMIFFCIVMPIWVAITFNIICLVRFASRSRLQIEQQEVFNYSKTQLLYPLIQIICWAIESLQQLINPFGIKVPLALMLINFAFQCLIGFFDSLAYGWTTIIPTINLRKCNYYENDLSEIQLLNDPNDLNGLLDGIQSKLEDNQRSIETSNWTLSLNDLN